MPALVSGRRGNDPDALRSSPKGRAYVVNLAKDPYRGALRSDRGRVEQGTHYLDVWARASSDDHDRHHAPLTQRVKVICLGQSAAIRPGRGLSPDFAVDGSDAPA